MNKVYRLEVLLNQILWLQCSKIKLFNSNCFEFFLPEHTSGTCVYGMYQTCSLPVAYSVKMLV